MYDKCATNCRLRSHTASVHKMKITEYKNRFGADLDILEVVFHRFLMMVVKMVIMIVVMLIVCWYCSFHLTNTIFIAMMTVVQNIRQTQLKLHLRCGVCSNLVLFDNDAIAVHLKSGNHPRITHKDYNRCLNLIYM